MRSCGYKLMPAVQQIYNASSQIRFAEPSLAAVYDDFHDVGAETEYIY